MAFYIGDKMTEKINLKLTTMITIATLVGSIIGSHYKAIADGKEYTDKKVEAVEKDVKQEQKEIKEKLEKQQIDVEVIKQILIKQYGEPKKNG